MKWALRIISIVLLASFFVFFCVLLFVAFTRCSSTRPTLEEGPIKFAYIRPAYRQEPVGEDIKRVDIKFDESLYCNASVAPGFFPVWHFNGRDYKNPNIEIKPRNTGEFSLKLVSVPRDTTLAAQPDTMEWVIVVR